MDRSNPARDFHIGGQSSSRNANDTAPQNHPREIERPHEWVMQRWLSGDTSASPWGRQNATPSEAFRTASVPQSASQWQPNWPMQPFASSSAISVPLGQPNLNHYSLLPPNSCVPTDSGVSLAYDAQTSPSIGAYAQASPSTGTYVFRQPHQYFSSLPAGLEFPQSSRSDLTPAIRVTTDFSGTTDFQQQSQDVCYSAASVSSNTSIPIKDSYYNAYGSHLSPIGDARYIPEDQQEMQTPPRSPYHAAVSRQFSRKRSHSVMSGGSRPHADASRAASLASEAYLEPLSFSVKRGDPPSNLENKYICDFSSECAGLTFDRKCEWSKHMDKHDRPYRCTLASCSKLGGFTYSGGLLRHEREVHGKHGGPKAQIFCPEEICKRHSGKGFTRIENLNEHIRRVHGSLTMKVSPPDEASSSKPEANAITNVRNDTYERLTVNDQVNTGVKTGDLRVELERLRDEARAKDALIQQKVNEMRSLQEEFNEMRQHSQQRLSDMTETPKVLEPVASESRAQEADSGHIESNAHPLSDMDSASQAQPIDPSRFAITDASNDQTRDAPESMAGVDCAEEFSVTGNSSDSTAFTRTLAIPHIDRNNARSINASSVHTHDARFGQPLAHAVQDLHRRISYLFRQTGPAQRYCGSLRRPLFSRRHSLTLPLDTGGGGQNRNNSTSSEAPYTDITHSESGLALSPVPGPRKKTRRSGLSDSGVNTSRSRNDLRDSSLRNQRSYSEPPLSQMNGRHELSLSENIRTCVHGGTTHGSTGRDGLGSTTAQQGVSRKRKAQNCNQGQDDQHEEGNGPGEKRRRVTGAEFGTIKNRLPCIFHVGEPRRYSKHTKKYPFISHLRRHLKSHDFHVCTKCFKQFSSSILSEAHKQSPCRKSCQSDKCWRYIPEDAELPLKCECITTAEQQWIQLFLLQYPNLEVPDVFSEATNSTELDNALDYDFGFGISNGDNVWDTLITDPQIDSLDSPLCERTFAESSQSNANDRCHGPQADTSLNDHVQLLRERVLLLEQRTSEPSEREQDLEMVLANVWQALIRSNSAESQPDSPLWRLMMRHARNVISTTPLPNQIQPSQMHTNSDFATSNAGPANSYWTQLINNQNQSRGVRSDSGYHELR